MIFNFIPVSDDPPMVSSQQPNRAIINISVCVCLFTLLCMWRGIGKPLHAFFYSYALSSFSSFCYTSTCVNLCVPASTHWCLATGVHRSTTYWRLLHIAWVTTNLRISCCVAPCMHARVEGQSDLINLLH